MLLPRIMTYSFTDALLLFIGPCFILTKADAPTSHHDVFIYGCTPSGIQAAMAAAGEGKSVLMASSMPLLGGMMTGGLGNTDKGHSSAIGGSALDFFQVIYF